MTITHGTKRAALAAVMTLALGASTARAMPQADCDEAGVSGHGACFGLEPTFTNQTLLDEVKTFGGKHKGETPEKKAALIRWRDAIVALCATARTASGRNACRVEKYTRGDSPCVLAHDAPSDVFATSSGDLFRVCLYSDDASKKPWYYVVAYDPGVLELSTRPANAPWIDALANDGTLQTYLWDVAATNALLTPNPAGAGSGHVHIDLESGFRSVRQFLNFMTGIHNLKLLPLTTNKPDTIGRNATPFSVLGPEIRRRYRALLVKHQNDTSVGLDPLLALKDELVEDVYVYNYASARMDEAMEFPSRDENYVTAKYHSINMHADLPTIEFRGLNPQRTAKDLALILRVFQGVIDRTSDNAVVPLLDDAKIAMTNTDNEVLVPANQRRFHPTNKTGDRTIDPADAAFIATAFLHWIGDDKATCTALLGYMPTEVRTAATTVCK